ncbi:CEP295 N-terminal-like protein isoform X1 [Vicugna pacos]|uniref:CEP295 N-terminal-like protein isoform X1 n=1 Tax=Vicugna pacos TaxID=30538 RepID=A0ABM5BHF0_VICPA
MKRNTERAARWSPSPDDEASLSRQKHKLLQVRETGDVPLQRRQDLQQRESQLLQRLAQVLGAQSLGAPDQQVRGLERLWLAHLLGVGGGRAEDRALDLEGLAQRGAARPPRAGGKPRAAVRAEKSHREELVRRQPWHSASLRGAVDQERQGASRAPGLSAPPPSPPERRKGKRGPSVKTGGGRRPVDPELSRGSDVGKLLALAREITCLEKWGREAARDGRRLPGKGSAHPAQGPRATRLHQSPEGPASSPEQLWPAGWAHRSETSPLACPRRFSNKSRWQRELEFAFEELFNTNRKLKKHLDLYLDLKPRTEQSPSEEQGFLGMQSRSRESQREKKARDPEADIVLAGEPMSPAGVDIHLTPSKTSLKMSLSTLENPKSHRMAKCVVQNDSAQSPEAGMLMGRKNLFSCSPESGQEPRRPCELHPRGQVDRAGLIVARQKQKMQMERQRPKQLELLKPFEHPKESLGADLQTEPEGGRREPRQADLARLRPDSRPDPGKEGAYDCSPASPSAGFVDDDGHSQMIVTSNSTFWSKTSCTSSFLKKPGNACKSFRDYVKNESPACSKYTAHNGAFCRAWYPCLCLYSRCLLRNP